MPRSEINTLPTIERNTMTHPSQRISHENRGHLLSDLRNVTTALQEAIVHGISVGAPSEKELAELVWFAGRVRSEAIAALAQKLCMDDQDIREVLADPPFADPDEHPELAARLNSLVDGLVEVL